MFHRDEYRVRGNVFICVFAYYLQKIIDLKLKKSLSAGSGSTYSRKEYSTIRAIEKLGQIKMIKNRQGDKVFYQAIQPKREHNMILVLVRFLLFQKCFSKNNKNISISS